MSGGWAVLGDWSEQPGRLELAGPRVHVWRIRLAPSPEPLERAARLLSPEERRRADAFRVAEARAAFVRTRAALRRILGAYLAVAPDAVRLGLGPQGKPYCENAPDLQFNVAHSGQWALCAAARRRPVGVDVERVRPLPDWAALAGRFFSPSEQQRLAALPADRRLAGFFALWAAKEAYVKGRGAGLGYPLAAFDVVLDGADARLAADRADPTAPGRWRLAMLDAAPGYAAAVAVADPDAAVERLLWRGGRRRLHQP